MAQELKKREEMDPRWQWHLNDIFESAEAFEAAFAQARQAVENMKRWQGHAAEDPKQAIRDVHALYLLLDRLGAYAFMYQDEDSSDPIRQALAERMDSLYVSANGACSFLNPELLALPTETLEALMNAPDFAEYSEVIRLLILEKPHTLPADQEALLAAAGEICGVAGQVFSMFNDVDLPLPMVTMEDGEKHQLTHGNYSTLIDSQNREVRKEAFEGLHGTFEKFSATLTAAYAGSVKGDVFRARARHYDSARQAALKPLEIPESVYDNLLEQVEAALPTMAEYLKLRKETLGVDELHLYDLYVPMIRDFDMKMTYPEAFDLVCEGLAPLGEEYIAKLREAYESGWVDVYENKAKCSGAYSNSCYGVHPYVLLNHTDDLGGAMTLAHELGHAMHSYYSNSTQPFAKANYSLFVAEVASTCNEVLLMRHLMKKYQDNPQASAFLCNQLLEEFRTTVFRQTMFAAFEKESHAMHERGEALTAEALNAVYYGLNQKYYGAVCHVDDVVKVEWMRIPHFYRGFYVYQYATGFSAAVAIASRILREGDKAVADYKRFLSAGCSVPPLEALRYAGVDMEKPDAVHDALQVFAETVEDLKKLLQH